MNSIQSTLVVSKNKINELRKGRIMKSQATFVWGANVFVRSIIFVKVCRRDDLGGVDSEVEVQGIDNCVNAAAAWDGRVQRGRGEIV